MTEEREDLHSIQSPLVKDLLLSFPGLFKPSWLWCCMFRGRDHVFAAMKNNVKFTLSYVIRLITYGTPLCVRIWGAISVTADGDSSHDWEILWLSFSPVLSLYLYLNMHTRFLSCLSRNICNMKVCYTARKRWMGLCETINPKGFQNRNFHYCSFQIMGHNFDYIAVIFFSTPYYLVPFAVPLLCTEKRVPCLYVPTILATPTLFSQGTN